MLRDTHIPRSEMLERQQHEVLIELSSSPNRVSNQEIYKFDIQQRLGKQFFGKAIAPAKYNDCTRNREPNSSNLLFTYL